MIMFLVPSWLLLVACSEIMRDDRCAQCGGMRPPTTRTSNRPNGPWWDVRDVPESSCNHPLPPYTHIKPSMHPPDAPSPPRRPTHQSTNGQATSEINKNQMTQVQHQHCSKRKTQYRSSMQPKLGQRCDASKFCV